MGDGVSEVLDRAREIRLLAGLCRALAELGVNVGFSDARPAVRVPVGGRWAGLSVLADSSADLFTWGDGQTHEISDRAGAAVAIVAYVKELEAAEAAQGSPDDSSTQVGEGGSDACGD